MTYKTTYEWVVEYCDENGDIEDLNHFDKIADAVVAVLVARQTGKADLGLVRDTWETDLEDLDDRQWAYVTDLFKLPELFDGGAAVPLRFHKQLAKVAA